MQVKKVGGVMTWWLDSDVGVPTIASYPYGASSFPDSPARGSRQDTTPMLEHSTTTGPARDHRKKGRAAVP